MPGRNCCIPGCHIYRKKGGVSIFNVPKQEDEYNSNWRDKLINIVSKYREIDSGFRDQIRRKDLAICEIHYQDSCKIRRKLYILIVLRLNLCICKLVSQSNH